MLIKCLIVVFRSLLSIFLSFSRIVVFCIFLFNKFGIVFGIFNMGFVMFMYVWMCLFIYCFFLLLLFFVIGVLIYLKKYLEIVSSYECASKVTCFLCIEYSVFIMFLS